MRSSPAAPTRTADRPLAGMHLAIAYDCLFPWTVGGAERWYRHLAEAAVQAGAAVTYLTRHQWDQPPEIPGVEVMAVSKGGDLYDAQGRRLLGPTLWYGVGVLWHLVRHRRSYDIVQVANFPFWSLIAARAALIGTGRTVVVDWHEVWSARFWREYAGGVVGSVGWLVQRLCIALSRRAVTTSPRNARRLRQAGCRREPVVLPGYFPSELRRATPVQARGARLDERPYALFVGRHIRDKGVDLLPALAARLAALPSSIDLVVAGDGPGRAALEAALEGQGLARSTRCVGFVDDAELRALMSDAVALIVPSRREGYGIVVVEAASHGTPAVVADFPENLATGHIENGRNGYVASPAPSALAAAVGSVVQQGDLLRTSTRAWFEQEEAGRTIEQSARIAIEHYATVR